MNEEIDNAIKFLCEKNAGEVKSHEALQFTQAALNLAHVKQVLAQATKQQ